jgi:hypothetical protein
MSANLVATVFGALIAFWAGSRFVFPTARDWRAARAIKVDIEHQPGRATPIR